MGMEGSSDLACDDVSEARLGRAGRQQVCRTRQARTAFHCIRFAAEQTSEHAHAADVARSRAEAKAGAVHSTEVRATSGFGQPRVSRVSRSCSFRAHSSMRIAHLI